MQADDIQDDLQQVYLSFENDKDKDVIPFVCFYNGLSFLKRLPTLDEVSGDKRLDLLAGYRTKDSFIELKHEHKINVNRCKSDL
jgi:hypothetical protein